MTFTVRIFRFVAVIVLVTIGKKSCFAHDGADKTSCIFQSIGSSRPPEATWSTPEECMRPCIEDEAPRYCYYRFTLEYYSTMNDACTLCRPNNTNQLSNVGRCQCVEADGFERTILSVNRMLPGPSIQVCERDVVIVDVVNMISGIETALHWHGVLQEGYQYYDGVPHLTQCPIHSGGTFRYQFRVKNPGTHFWHSHVAIHKIDGQYGSLIVRRPYSEDPQKKLYDEDLSTHVVVLSDWMHELSMEHFPGLLKRLKGQGPANVLINGKGRWEDPATGESIANTSLAIFDVEPGKRYRFRVINAFSTVCLAHLNIEDHTVTIIAQDANDVIPRPIDSIITASGERVDIVLTANQPANRSYWIVLRAINEAQQRSVIQLGVLRYTTSPSTIPSTPRPTYFDGLHRGIIYNPLNSPCNEEDEKMTICAHQFESIPENHANKELLAVDAEYQFVIPFKLISYRDDIENLFTPGTYKHFLTAPDRHLQVSIVDGIIYQEPAVPPILAPENNDCKCNGTTNTFTDGTINPRLCTHTLDVKRNAIVEIVLVDESDESILNHPFHLHGHAFRVFEIGRFPRNSNVTRGRIEPILRNHRQRLIEGIYNPGVPAKDTVVVPQGGWVILRFKANNPGWWFFHCHFVWHTMIGMNIVIHVGEQSDLPPIPPDFPRCGPFTPPIELHD